MREAHGENESPNLMPDHCVPALWERFRDGGGATCPRDGALLALSVDGAAKSYRLVCTQCGIASHWFEATPSGVAMRSPATTLVPQPVSDD
jgi:hypothetical protein